MSTTKQKLPDWFDGELYEKGDIVKNPYSGESIELNNIELSMYDFVIKELQDGLYWFRKNNAKAYMVLLD
jgi:hypothetical protein